MCRNSIPLVVVQSDMGRSVVSLSCVVEYPCLASPGPSRTILSRVFSRVCWAFACKALFQLRLLSFQRLCLSFYSNMTLVLCCTINMVRARGRVGAALFLSRKVAARLSECVAVVEVARLKSENVAREKKRNRSSRVIGCMR